MTSVTPFLWFNGNVDEAIDLYTSVFDDSAVEMKVPGPEGKTFMAKFSLAGQDIMALDGGPNYSFTPAISLFISVETQEEIDYFWNSLTADGGEESMCGWLVDKFGLSWQVVPESLGRLMGDPDPQRSGRVRNALLEMQKIDLAVLEAAHAG